MSAEPSRGQRTGKKCAPAHTDWLYHHLTVTGPVDHRTSFGQAAAGAGIIPWRLDLDRLEEDFFLRLAAPPSGGQRSLSLNGARMLAAELREAISLEPGGAVAAWEDPARAAAASAAPVLVVDGFEGPLDWLLGLARAERIDLRKLSILALVEAFAASLERALSAPAPADLTRWGEFLSMVAQLALLRSRLLLPPDAPEAVAARADAEALRRRLLQADAMRRVTAWLDAQVELGRDVFGRGVADAERRVGGRRADIADLFRACLVVLRVPDLAERYAPAIPILAHVPRTSNFRALLRAFISGKG